jgi:hypothetical protein
MLKLKKSLISILIIGFLPVFVAGCGNSAKDSAFMGAVIGTSIGAIAGGDPASMAIGGVVGGGIGYLFGNEKEKQSAGLANNQYSGPQMGQQTGSQTAQQVGSRTPRQGSETVWIINSNGSRTPVEMIKSGSSYIGPRNDHYASLPSGHQLKSAYGF